MTCSGSAVSSPSDAAASKPMKPVNASTTARNRPCTLGSWPGSNGLSVTPASLPLASTITSSNVIAATLPTPITSWVRVETRTSSSAITVSTAIRIKNHQNQPSLPKLMCTCADITWFMKKPEITITNEIPAAKPPKYSQPAMKPPPEPSPRDEYVYTPPALAIRRVKRMATEARQRLPAPATMYAHGAATPASAATTLVASELASASDSSANDCANASPRPSTPCLSCPGPSFTRLLSAIGTRVTPSASHLTTLRELPSPSTGER
jgi:hypothetical protein